MLLEAAHISKRFGSRPQVLTDVSFGVEPGEFVSVIGPSGAGKTTLFRILNGTLPCDGGEVCIDGQPFSRARGRAKRAVQKRIGTIYQDFALVEPVSCRQNVLNACLPDMALPAALLGLFSRAQIAEAERLLARVGLADKCDEPVCDLSGGQKQRVAIARALMRRPALLLADEPVASLDPVTGRQILALLQDIQRTEGVAILMNSHNLDPAPWPARRADRARQRACRRDGCRPRAHLRRRGKRGRAMTRARGRRWARALGVLALFVLAFWLTGCDPAVFWARRAHLRDIVSQLFPPDWSYLSAIVAPLLATLRMSVTGTALGVLLALILAPLCAANLPCPAPVRRILRFLVQVLRSFPALILALLATFLFGLGTFSGTVAITLFTLAVMTRMTYEDIETLTLAPYRALCAMGASPARAYARAVVPEIASGYLTNALYLLETNVRHSAILGYVGAGGIGLLLNEKISWREYGRVGAILVCLFVTVCCIEWLSHVLGRIIRGERSIPRGAKRAIWAAVLVCVVVCTAGIEAPDLAHTSKSVLAAMGTGLLHPDWSFFFGTGKDGLGWLLLETVGIALAGTGLGALLALPLAFLSTPKLLPRPVALLFRVLIVAIRSVPFLIYGLIFIRVSGPGAFTGVLTLAVCSIGLLSKRFTEAIESLDFRAYDALRAMGVSLLPRIRYAVLPQLGPAFSSAVLYRFDVNIREASVLGLVGAGGIGAPLIFAMNQYAWNDVSAIFLGFVLLVWLIDVGSARLRTRRTAAAAPGK